MDQQMDDVNESHENNNGHITIQALRRETRVIISDLLNPKKVIRSEKGLLRDWQGLAELCCISGQKIPSLQEEIDPTNKVLNLWYENDKTESTIDKLILYLEELDRFDVIDDIQPLIEKDIKFFKEHPNGIKPKPLDLENDKHILTVDDVSRLHKGLAPQIYDAFVLFADDDIDFATNLIETMEKNYNLKLCVKDRDLVGGGFEHDSMIKLISERCGRLIVIISTAFLDSYANKFFYSFAQAIGIEQRKRKIVPCLYKSSGNLPPELSCYHMLDFGRSGILYDFWEKLYNSIRTPQTAAPKNINSISRSFSHNSTSKQCLTRSVLHHENAASATLKPINQVKFNSLMDLNSLDTEKIIPDENLTSSTSANSLGTYPPPTTKKRKSLRNILKQIIKPKNTKNDEIKVDLAKFPKIPDVDIENKEKKRTFFSIGSKRKKAVIAS